MDAIVLLDLIPTLLPYARTHVPHRFLLYSSNVHAGFPNASKLPALQISFAQHFTELEFRDRAARSHSKTIYDDGSEFRNKYPDLKIRNAADDP
jgi:hypothetical protein